MSSLFGGYLERRLPLNLPFFFGGVKLIKKLLSNSKIKNLSQSEIKKDGSKIFFGLLCRDFLGLLC